MIPTAKELQKSWNLAAKTYACTLEKANLQLGFSLARMMNITSAQNILESCSGSGVLTFNLLPTLSKGAKYIATDISDEMIKLAQERMESFKGQLDHVDLKFIQADAENLSFIPNETIDAYLSSLCFHLVPDANKTLQEAKRIIRKGGKIGFSVLGKKENSSFSQIFNDRLKEFGVVLPESRGIYHLSAKEKLIQLAKDNGIKPDFCWIENVVMGVHDESALQMILDLPGNKRILGGLDEETKTKFIKAMKDDFHNKQEQLEPLLTENILFVGTKE